MGVSVAKLLTALCLTAILSACMDGGVAETPPPAQSRAEELNLYRDVCVVASQSGDFGSLANQLRRLGYAPGTSVALGGSPRNSVTGWTRPGSDISVFIGATDRTRDLCAVVFPGVNPATGVNAPVAEARLWYLSTLDTVGRAPSGLISSAPIRVIGANGKASTLSYELAAGGLAVYAANYN